MTDLATYDELNELCGDYRDQVEHLKRECHMFLQALETVFAKGQNVVVVTVDQVDDETRRTRATVNGQAYDSANGDTIMLCADGEVLDDGYDERDGQRYKRIKAGRCWWYVIVNDAVVLVTTQKPERNPGVDSLRSSGASAMAVTDPS